MTDFRGLCARMADELDHYRQLLMDDRRETHALATETRAALAQTELQHTDDDLDEFANFWWGPETDDLTVATAIENGQMTAFVRAIVTWLTE